MDHINFSEIKYLEFLPGLFLKRGSVHQIAGPSRFIFALIIARNIINYITWIRGKESAVSLYPDGLTSWADISKLILVDTRTNQESMWVMEEFLKSLNIRKDFLIQLKLLELIYIFQRIKLMKQKII